MTGHVCRGILHDNEVNLSVQELHHLHRALHGASWRLSWQWVWRGGLLGVVTSCLVFVMHVQHVLWWLQVLAIWAGLVAFIAWVVPERAEPSELHTQLQQAFFDLGLDVAFMRCAHRTLLTETCTYLGMEVVSVVQPLWVELYFLSAEGHVTLVRFTAVAQVGQVGVKMQRCEGDSRMRVERALGPLPAGVVGSEPQGLRGPDLHN